MFINFSLCLSIGIAVKARMERSSILINTVGFSAFAIALILFFLLKLFVVSNSLIIVLSGLFFLITLLICYALNKSKV
jgi:hypothetical protein